MANNLVKEREKCVLVSAKQGVYHIRHLAQQIRVFGIFIHELLFDNLK